MNTASIGLAVTPTVVSTFLSHYVNRKPLRHKPTAHLSYDEGLHLIRSFLNFASHHTVEELQAFTAQWVPHPQWVKVDEVEIPATDLDRAAGLLEQQLGPDGIRQVGGKNWWQWREPKSPLKAEWIEMKADHKERERNGDPGNRVMFYVHGGAYFFGSVGEHRYQMQRHARKLKARAFAPSYRLAPQFPFPCALQDCLAAYLFLLKYQEPETIILAGDSAGGGMVMAMLVTLRDRGIPLPAGAVLISPWVDLTHSFPSVAGECPLDYIPQAGFHHKPSRAWPPPNDDEIEELQKIIDQKKSQTNSTVDSDPNNNAPSNVSKEKTHMSITIDGKQIEIKEQIQMYATNELLSHPLVSPVMQPTLGGLPPLLIMVGGGEFLRDEQVYLAHKCAHPADYLPAESLMDDNARTLLEKYKPTDVQLQVWDDLCHVAPTLSFTRPAKYMFRSIAQFGAWALARAQRIEIDILDDDEISVISSSDSDSPGNGSNDNSKEKEKLQKKPEPKGSIGRAGDPLPPFKDHMIRQRVTRHGDVYHLPPARELPGCKVLREDIGVIKPGPVGKWIEQKDRWGTRFKQSSGRVHKKRIKDLTIGYEVFPEGDIPPPSALAGRRKMHYKEKDKKRVRSLGLSLWSLWGSKHDEATVQREEQAVKAPETTAASAADGHGARSFPDIQGQTGDTQRAVGPSPSISRSRSRRRTVKDEGQVEGGTIVDEETPVATLLALRKANGESSSGAGGFLSPSYVPDTGVTGKRPIIDGISMPFTIRKEADTASMMTLNSAMDNSGLPSPRPTSPLPLSPSPLANTSAEAAENAQVEVQEKGITVPSADNADAASSPTLPQFLSPATSPALASPSDKPPLERFITAEEDVPKQEASSEGQGRH